MTLTHKFLTIGGVDDQGIIKGNASFFNVPDSIKDVILTGAFDESLATNKSRPLLWQHDPLEPIGKVDFSIEGNVLKFDAKTSKSEQVPNAQKAFSLLKEGVIEGVSIGFKILKSYIDKKTDIRYIEKAELWELSVVTFPAMPGAGVTEIKSDAPQTWTLRELEAVVKRDANVSRNEAKALVAKALGIKQDAQEAVDDTFLIELKQFNQQFTKG